MSIEIDVLKAYEGDCFFITLKDENQKYRILVDGGTEDTYDDVLKDKLDFIINSESEFIDLLIITHIDDDHIGGIKRFFEDENIGKEIINKKIKNIWYNSAEVISKYIDTSGKIDISGREVKLGTSDLKISKSNANTLEKAIKDMGVKLQVIKALDVYEDLFEHMKITILSPNDKKLKKINKEWIDERAWISKSSSDYKKSIEELNNEDKGICNDSSISNGSSIAFLLEYGESFEKKILFLGDAHNCVITKSLMNLGYSKKKKLKVDIVKLSHHASNSNTSCKLIEMMNCDKYIVSSNGIIKNLPGKKCLSRIIRKNINSPTFYFNYDIIDEIFNSKTEEEIKQHKFKCEIINNPLEV